MAPEAHYGELQTKETAEGLGRVERFLYVAGRCCSPEAKSSMVTS